MLFRYNERISLKFFDSQDDGLFQIGRKGAPVNASLLIIIFPNCCYILMNVSLPSV